MNFNVSEEIKKIPKSDLHVHFNGAVPTQIFKKLIQEHGITIPADFNVEVDLQILRPVNGLVEYFKPWKAFKLLPVSYSSLQIMMNETFRRLSEDNVRYVELRNSPFYISRLNKISLEDSLLWLIESVQMASQTYSIAARLIFSITRHEYNVDDTKHLFSAIKKVNSNKIIVGVDLAGDEDFLLNNSEISKFFRNVKYELGLGITIHAGETGNEKNVEWAINECLADRIGHGTAVAKSEKLMDLIKKKDICLEVCLTSNIMSGSCTEIRTHFIRTFVEYDIPFVLCTDNPSVHNISLTDEYVVFLEQFGNRDLLNRIISNSDLYSFKS